MTEDELDCVDRAPRPARHVQLASLIARIIRHEDIIDFTSAGHIVAELLVGRTGSAWDLLIHNRGLQEYWHEQPRRAERLYELAHDVGAFGAQVRAEESHMDCQHSRRGSTDRWAGSECGAGWVASCRAA